MSVYARWRPLGAKPTYGKPPKVGDIIGIEYRAWRVLDVRDGDDKCSVALERVDGDDKRVHEATAARRHSWEILPEHYSVCVRCGDVQPCREQEAEQFTDRASKRATRYEVPGICPACLEPTTARQQTLTFDENIVVPLGPAVTFHLRRKCIGSAIAYDRDLAKQNKCTPKLEQSLTCSGSLYQHRDGITTCTNLECPSALAHHRYWALCTTRSHGCPRFECEFGIPA